MPLSLPVDVGWRVDPGAPAYTTVTVRRAKRWGWAASWTSTTSDVPTNAAATATVIWAPDAVTVTFGTVVSDTRLVPSLDWRTIDPPLDTRNGPPAAASSVKFAFSVSCAVIGTADAASGPTLIVTTTVAD